MDINNDGKIDLIAGDTQGNIWFFENVGSKGEPKLAAGVKLQADGKTIVGALPRPEKGPDGKMRTVMPDANSLMGVYSKLHVTDWDGDGMLDIVVGQDSYQASRESMVLYRNIGTKEQMKLAAPVPLKIIKGQELPRPSPYVVDWDGDGKRDVLLGTDINQVMFLRNIGTNEKPQFAAPEKIDLPGLDKCSRCRIAVVDWNNDGKLDLVVGTFYSGQGADKKGMGGNVWVFLRK